MSGVKRQIRHPLLTFFALCFALSCSLWILLAIFRTPTAAPRVQRSLSTELGSPERRIVRYVRNIGSHETSSDDVLHPCLRAVVVGMDSAALGAFPNQSRVWTVPCSGRRVAVMKEKLV